MPTPRPRLPAGGVPVGDGPVPDPVRLVLDAGRQLRLSVYDVGLACCAVELVAAAVAYGRPAPPAGPAPVPAPGGPVVEVMVVAGTVTDRMAPALLGLYAALPEPRAVLSFGACSNTGGPYWDSYAVTKGVDQLLPVDVYVAGCPPRPEALLAGLRELAERIASR